VLAGDRVILRFGHWIYGLKTSDGAEVWEHREPEPWCRIGATTFSTPLVVNIDKTPVVITLSGQFIRASDGKMLADLDLYASIYGGAEMVAAPVVDKGVVYFPVDTRRGPEGRLFATRPLKSEKLIWKPHYLAVKLPDQISGDTLQTKILWKTETPNGFTATSPVVHNGLLYTRDYEGEWLRVFDIRDGSLVYEKELDWLTKSITVSPLTVAGGNLYITSSKVDRTLIIKTGREYVEVARNVRGLKKQNLRGWQGGFGLLYSASPVFSGTRMYWREGNRMYCFDKNAPSKAAGSSDESKANK
jgi:outer membrane protein assembly factor BamB